MQELCEGLVEGMGERGALKQAEIIMRGRQAKSLAFEETFLFLGDIPSVGRLTHLAVARIYLDCQSVLKVIVFLSFSCISFGFIQLFLSVLYCFWACNISSCEYLYNRFNI